MKKPEPSTESKTDSTSISTSSKSRKRPAGESSTTGRPRQNTPSLSHSAVVRAVRSERRMEPVLSRNPKTSVEEIRRYKSVVYLLEMFSVPLLRSHATVGLVDRDRLQPHHANRSAILVSSAINFSKDDGLTEFITTIAFNCLSNKMASSESWSRRISSW